MKFEQPKKLSDIVFTDIFSQATNKAKAKLMVVSFVTIILVTYNIQITKASVLGFDIPAKAPNLVQSSLAIITLYFFFYFVGYLFVDFTRWINNKEIVNWTFKLDRFIKIRELQDEIMKLLTPLKVNNLLNITPDQFPSPSRFSKLTDALFVEIKNLERSHKQIRRLCFINVIKLLVLDISVPLFLGGFAIYKSVALVWPLVKAVF